MVGKRIKLFYFSSTGNTLVAAKSIQRKLDNVEIYSISHCLKENNFPEAEVVGILFPVYMAGLPLIVRRFLESCDFSNADYIFSLATYGGFSGVSHQQINKLLKSKSSKLSAAFGLKMPDNYIPFFKKPEVALVRELMTDVDESLNEIVKFVNNQVLSPVASVGLMGPILSIVYNLGSKQIPKMDKKFRVNDKCNGCSVCSKVCPVSNIEMNNNKPCWKHHCEHCLACIHWCPQQAISFKKKLWQYHNPKVVLKDMYL